MLTLGKGEGKKKPKNPRQVTREKKITKLKN